MRSRDATPPMQEDFFMSAVSHLLRALMRLGRYLVHRSRQSPLVGLMYLVLVAPAVFLIVQDIKLVWAIAIAPRFTQPGPAWPLSAPMQPEGIAALVCLIILAVVLDRGAARRSEARGRAAIREEAAPDIGEWVLGKSYRRVWNPDPGEFQLEATDELYRLTAEHLRTHLIVVAPSGSGKTQSVLEPALYFFKRTGAAAIYLDAKGDSFDPRQFHLNFDLSNPEGSMRLLVWSGRTPREMAERLGEALVTETGTEPRYYIDNAKNALAALVEAHYRAYGKMPALELLLTYLRSAEARDDMAEQLREAGVPEKGSELEDIRRLNQLAEQKNDVLGSLDTALAPLCRGAIADMLVPDAESGYSIEQLVAQPVRVRFAISTNHHPNIAPIIGRLVMAQFTYAVVSPDCNKAILKAIVADEAKRFVTPTVADGMAMARENRGAFLLAFQNLSQIANPTLRQDILSVAGNKLVMAGVDDYDAEKFSRLFGSREQRYVSHSQNTSQGSNSSRSRGSGREGGDVLSGGAPGLRHQSSHMRSSSAHQSQGSTSRVRERAHFLPSEIRELPQFHVLIERRDSRGQITPATVVNMDYELISDVGNAQALRLYDQVGRLEAVSPRLPRVAPGLGQRACNGGNGDTGQASQPGATAGTQSGLQAVASRSETAAPPTASFASPVVAAIVQPSESVRNNTTGDTSYPEWIDEAAQLIAQRLAIKPREAAELARQAYENSRDITYIMDNINHATAAANVKSPAGLFRFLIKNNHHRHAPAIAGSKSDPTIDLQGADVEAGT